MCQLKCQVAATLVWCNKLTFERELLAVTASRNVWVDVSEVNEDYNHFWTLWLNLKEINGLTIKGSDVLHLRNVFKASGCIYCFLRLAFYMQVHPILNTHQLKLDCSFSQVNRPRITRIPLIFTSTIWPFRTFTEVPKELEVPETHVERLGPWKQKGSNFII